MEEHVCPRCDYKTPYKQALIKHLQKAKEGPTPKANIPREDIIKQLQKKEYNDKTYGCPYCQKKFNSCSNKSRHLKVCKKKPQPNNDSSQSTNLENELKAVNLENEILRKRVEELESKTLSVNINNMVINNNVSIVLNSYGHENMEYISKEFLTDCVMKTNKGLVKLVKEVHFNPDHSENHTVRLKSMRYNLLEKHVDGNWLAVPKTTILEDMISRYVKVLIRHKVSDENLLEMIDDNADNDHIRCWLINVHDVKKPDIINMLKRDVFEIILYYEQMMKKP